eukprot:Rhum_TRINITY_DN11421_c0_g2::Rhum_TRINITY_DN11421_c0_g2_i3::g.44561::m.44561
MPMGWSYAPAIAQSTSVALLGWLHLHCAAAIIDDLIICGPDDATVRERLAFVQGRIAQANAQVSAAKSELVPKEVITYGGIEWNLQDRSLRLPEDWRLRTRVLLGALLRGDHATLRAVWRVVGRVVWTLYATGEWLSTMGRMLEWVREAGRKVAEGVWEWDSSVRQ